MQWIKSSIETTSEGVEPVFGVLYSCGINGVQIIDTNDLQDFLKTDSLQWDYIDEALLLANDKNASLEFYVTSDLAGQETLNQISSQLSVLKQNLIGIPLGSLKLTSKLRDDETWLNEWKKYYKPFRIGKNITVVPVWEAFIKSGNDIVFTIDPGSVFGTGLHQSTQLCLEALECFLQPEDKMLDVGCGSGILSIVGLLLGAGSVLACDFDPAAVISTHSNIKLNPVDPLKIRVLAGDIFSNEELKKELNKQLYDVVTVNIVADAIIKLAPLIKPHLKPNGLIISSGIISERADEVIDVFITNGYSVTDVFQRDGWHCLVCRADNE